MNKIPAFKRYVLLMLGAFALTLLPLFALSLKQVNTSLEGRSNTRLASQWQQASRGVISAPSPQETSYLKLLRLKDRLPEIDTVVFGASTTFGLEQDMFPAPLRMYNFSKNGVGLSTMIVEAEYLLDHAPEVKWFIIPLDWSVGLIYATDAPPKDFDLFADLANDTVSKRYTWPQKIDDALSYPRISAVLRMTKTALLSKNKATGFRQTFLQASSDVYACPDGTPAKDFDLQSMGGCRGFRHDGSWTFNGQSRVGNAQRLIAVATASNSKFTQSLQKAKGAPNPVYLQRLAAVAQKAKQQGGGVIFIMPPLLSGMEAEFIRHPEWSGYLATTKKTLSDWAKNEGLVLFDASQSERFGCSAGEFIDEHHATRTCYQKVFSSFWQNGGALNRTGALTPNGKN